MQFFVKRHRNDQSILLIISKELFLLYF